MKKSIRLFPFWALLISTMALIWPQLFSGFKQAIMPLLMIIMLCMGLSLLPKDFARVLALKRIVTLGVLLQFTVMPLAAWLICQLLSLGPELCIGMLLVGSAAGGTASNVMCYLARGDVALSITMTAVSTLLSIFLTPLLMTLLSGQLVDIPTEAITISLIQVIAIPVVLGVSANVYLPTLTQRLSKLLPLVSMLAILSAIAIVVSLNADRMVEVGLVVILAVFLHNSVGLLLGYSVPALLGYNPGICRTLAFEVGLQNSGLAAALAIKYFTPGAALPGAIFSIWHNISGSVLAGYWSQTPKENRDHKHPHQR